MRVIVSLVLLTLGCSHGSPMSADASIFDSATVVDIGQLDDNGPTGDADTDGATQSSALVKWHPGHYMLSNFVCTPQNLGLPAAQTQLDVVGATASLQGYALQVSWGLIETGQGVYDFSHLDAYFTILKKYSTPKRFALVISWGTLFAQSQGPTSAVFFPAYLASDVSQYGAGKDGTHSGYWGPSVGPPYDMAAAVHRAAVMDRFIALMQAVAAHYDGDPLFEGLMFQESAGTAASLSSAPDWSWAAFNTQYTRLAKAASIAFPHSNVSAGLNYDADRVATAAQMAAFATIGAGYSGP